MERARIWSGQNCLVTGALGFVGSHLCQKLISLGARVFALDVLPSPAGTNFGLLGLMKDATVIRADVTKKSDLAQLAPFQFDVVFHLAAQPISPLSNLAPTETMVTNVEGTKNLGEVLAHQELRPVFVFASSACWYGATTSSPLSERDSYSPGEFKYSESKVEAEKEVVKMDLDLDLPTIRCRFVNLYGPGDRHFSRVIPKTIRHLINNEPPTFIRNDGTTVLDFMYVGDAISAFLIAAENARPFRGEVFNFGVGDDNPRPVIEVAKLLSRTLDGAERTPILLNPHEPKTKKKFLDNSKAVQQLGWKPTVKLDQGLLTTLRWYQDNLNELEPLEY
jgi:nucleoside-diphosphate-sugar epimerase